MAAAVAIGFVAAALRRLEVVVVPLVVAVLIATVLAPPAAWLRRRGLPPAVATLIVFLGAGGILVGIGYWLVPVFASEINLVGPQLANGVDRLQTWLTDGPLGLTPSQVAGYRANLGANLSESLRSVPAGVFWGARTALDLSIGVVLTVVLSVFVVKDGNRVVDATLARLDPTGQRRLEALAQDLWVTLGGYVRGAAANGAINATVLAIGLSLLHVPLIVPLAVVSFISAFAPLVGAFVSGGIAALVALADGGVGRALAVVLLVIGIHLLEGYIAGPLVMGRAVRLPPAAVLLALSVGGVLGGTWGVLFAVPAAACGLAVYRWGSQHPLAAAAEAEAAAAAAAEAFILTPVPPPGHQPAPHQPAPHQATAHQAAVPRAAAHQPTDGAA